MFTSIINPDAAAFTSLRGALVTALLALMLHGPTHIMASGSEAGRAAAAVLGRAGASALLEDVADLAEQLSGVAAVNEAVHEHVFVMLLEAPSAS